MSMIEIKNAPQTSEVKTVDAYLAEVRKWIAENIKSEEGSLSRVWYRGMGAVRDDACQPGVYRDPFTTRAGKFWGKSLEDKRLNLERMMLNEFRTIGAAFFDPTDAIDVYLLAQHFGMPTRLLDWTTNPLAGLFFADRKSVV